MDLAKSRAAQDKLAEMVIKEHCGEFCSDFLRSLHANCDLDGFSVFIKSTATPEQGPQVYSITLRGKAPRWRTFSATILFFLPKAESICIHPISPEGMREWNIPIAPLLSSDGVGGLWGEHVNPLSAMRIAELVAKDMFDFIDPE